MDRKKITEVVCEFDMDNLSGPLQDAPGKLQRSIQEVFLKHPDHRDFVLRTVRYYSETSWEVLAERDETDAEMEVRRRLSEDNKKRSEKAAKAQLEKLKKEHPELFEK